MDPVDELDALATAAGVMYRKRHIETSKITLALATDIVLRQPEDCQRSYMSRLESAYKKGKGVPCG